MAQMLADPYVALREVPVDKGWRYDGLLQSETTGFNPLLRAVFYGQRSAMANWLKNPLASGRDANVEDRLVGELFFAVHDYLHCWSYFAIQNLVPRLGFGTAPITRRNVEDFAFCHLLTEAVATAGLDYWYLSTVNLNEICPIGTRLEGLTVSYREEHLSELRRFEPGLEVQSPRFFGELSRFYCSGEFPHFDVRALKRSPVLLRWLDHELNYGERQREYIRRWLSYLSDDAVRFSKEELNAPVVCSRPWQSRLIEDLGRLLWEKVKGQTPHHFRPTSPMSAVWRRRDLTRKDFRFLSAQAFHDKDLSDAFEGEDRETSFRHFFVQFVSSHDSRGFEPALAKLFPDVVRLCDYKLAVALFKHTKRLTTSRKPPVDLLTLN